MTNYYAEINQSGEVIRVIVSDSQEWCESRLGGTWIETKIDSEAEQYAGIGMGVDLDHPAKFAPKWTQPVPGGGGISDYGYPTGAYVWHGDRIYQSTTPNNVWEPTVFGWRDKTDLIPKWRQPLGAGDAWGLNDEVLHANRHYRSLIANNVWEPGAVGSEKLWLDITATEPPDDTPAAWKPWTSGLNADLYQIGDRVTHKGAVWRATTGNNHWEPGVFGWVQE
jgi:hypothetical protein